MLAELVARNRSYRRFDPKTPVPESTLRELVDLARQIPSGGNLQPLKYRLSASPETNGKIFPCLKWAGYLREWHGPAENERPTAYIIVLRDNEITTNFIIDHGLAAQTIKLAAVERGLGGCIVGTIDRVNLRNALEIPNRYEILIVIALGKPTEKVVIDEARNGDIRYWRDDKGVHHVPKRALDEIILA